jgi:hypothetical protein
MKEKIDDEALNFLRLAVSEYFVRETKVLAAEIYLHTKGGEEFEKNNPSKNHAWFGWAKDFERKLALLKEAHKKAVDYLDSVDPWK